MESCNEIISKLSYEQISIWNVHKENPDVPLFNVSYLFHAKSGFVYECFAKAIKKVVSRHGGFSSRFGGDVNNPMQFGPSDSEDKISGYIYFFEQAETFQEAYELIKMRSAVPFRLNLSSPIRTDIVPLNEDEFLVNITVHQIICDCWSASLFFNELSLLYNAYLDDESIALPSSAPAYMHYSLWLQQSEQQLKIKENNQYWLSYLDKVQAPSILEKYTQKSACAPFSGDYVHEYIPEELHRDVCVHARELAITPYVLYMTLFAAFLQQESLVDDLILSYPSSNRNMPGSDAILGPFTSLLPLRFQFKKSCSLRELAKSTYRNLLDNAEHDLCSLNDVIEDAEIEIPAQPFSLFKIVFGQVGKINRGLELDGVNIEGVPVHSGVTKTDLLIMLDLHDKNAKVYLEYACGLFTKEKVIHLWHNFICFIKAILRNNLSLNIEAITLAGN